MANAAGKVFNSDSDALGLPVTLQGDTAGEPTGLTRQDGFALVREESAEDIVAILRSVAGLLKLQMAVTIFDGASLASPGNATDILSTAIDMKLWPGVKTLIVTVALATGSVFNYTRQRGAVAAVTTSLNSATALTVASAYTFPIRVGPTDKINFQVATSGVINELLIEGGYSGIVS